MPVATCELCTLRTFFLSLSICTRHKVSRAPSIQRYPPSRDTELYEQDGGDLGRDRRRVGAAGGQWTETSTVAHPRKSSEHRRRTCPPIAEDPPTRRLKQQASECRRRTFRTFLAERLVGPLRHHGGDVCFRRNLPIGGASEACASAFPCRFRAPLAPVCRPTCCETTLACNDFVRGRFSVDLG